VQSNSTVIQQMFEHVLMVQSVYFGLLTMSVGLNSEFHMKVEPVP